MSRVNEYRLGYKKTKVGWIPEEWEISNLESVTSFITKGATPTTYGFSWENEGNGIPFLRSECVSESGFNEKRLSWIPEDADEMMSRSRVIPGDILMTITGNVGRVIRFTNTYKRANINQHIARIRVTSADPAYICFQLNRGFYATFYHRILTGQAYPQISLKQVRETPIALPSRSEQKALACLLSSWDREIEQTGALIDAKRRLKKGLMQQLLTGRLRFPQFGEPATEPNEAPEGWKPIHLGRCFVEREETNPSLPLLSITAERGVVARDEVDRKDTSNANKSMYKVIRPGDIGYNTMRMWQGVSALSDFEGIISPAYTVCVPRKGMHAPFFAYLFKYAPMIHLLYRYSQGLVDDTRNLKFHHFAQVPVVIPAESEQRYIADTLSSIDNEIGYLTRLADQLTEQKRGLMQKLLTGEVRVPV